MYTKDIFVKQNIVEAPDDGLGGPRWMATLEDGQVVVGRPSWMGSLISKSFIGTDWAFLQAMCKGDNKRIKRLSLWVPPYGTFTAPDGLSGYGYYEAIEGAVGDYRTQRGGPVSALAICWPDKDERGFFVNHLMVNADGRLEKWRRIKWLPCMIPDVPGEDWIDPSKKDLGVRVGLR